MQPTRYAFRSSWRSSWRELSLPDWAAHIAQSSLFLLLCSCAPVRQALPIAEESLGPTQITNATNRPSIEVRAVRYDDHVVLVARCSLLQGSTAAYGLTKAVRAECKASLADALARFQSVNAWGLAGLRADTARWSSSIGYDNVMKIVGTVRLSSPAH